MRYITFIFTLCIFFSCNNEEENDSNFSYLPDAVGGYSTINIIADQNLWDYGLKKYVEPIFTKEIEGLLNKEPEFDIQTIRSKAFNRLFQRQRFILMFVSSKKINSEVVTVKKDVYAKGQIIVQVSGKSEMRAVKVFNEKQLKISSVENEKSISIGFQHGINFLIGANLLTNVSNLL